MILSAKKFESSLLVKAIKYTNTKTKLNLFYKKERVLNHFLSLTHRLAFENSME